ncbi:MAG: cobalt ECF transporter T component CbiQ [Lentisphaerae bacterium]|nr:cobalt ECF transporter T component CbiQ [Lentisphaerota bacterium]
MHLIDCYAYTNRWQTRHPAEKAAFAGGLLALSLILPLAGSLVVLAVVSAVTLGGARVPPRVYLRTLAIPLVFIAVGSLSLLLSVSFGAQGVHVGLATDQMARATRLLGRAVAAASCLCFLGLTTPALDWLPLLRRLRVPSVIVDIMFVVYRLLFVFIERLAAMHTAHEARLGYASVRSTFRSSGLIGANLLVFALKRARGMEMGMAARGFGPEIPVLPLECKPSRAVMAAVVLVWLVVAVIGLAVQRWFDG